VAAAGYAVPWVANAAQMIDQNSKCRHLDCDRRCTNPRTPITGLRAGTKRCAACPHYEGPLRGLGDVVHAVATVTGVAAVVKTVAPDCGCQKRREKLNRQFPSSP
jgi:hypothetical protein